MDFLNVAQEKEIYERWLTLYPFMEIGQIEFISFSDYKKKILENARTRIKNDNLTSEEIIRHGFKIEKAFRAKGR